MLARSVAVVGALALVLGACGGPYYDTCDPYDYYSYCYDPWGYCDAYGCYGLEARVTPASALTANAPGGSGAAVTRDIAMAVGAARAVQRLAPAPDASGVMGPVNLDASTAPGAPAGTYRLVIDRGTGAARWRLEAKPAGAPDDSYQAVFTGASGPTPGGRDGQGVFGVDLDALGALSPGALDAGQVLGSFTDGGGAQATAYRLVHFREPGAATLPDTVFTDVRAARGDGRLTAQVAGELQVPPPPAAMPAIGS